MNDLLTTKDLQALLCVDRKTIYRMLKDGRLPAVRVGGQWRFQRQAIDAWLTEPAIVQKARSAEITPLPADVLPLDCFASVQQVFAEALEVGALTTNLTGEILIEPSNCCEFCSLILSTPEGRQQCTTSWGRLSRTAPSPRIERCHAGLSYARAKIQVDSEFIGMVFAGQFLTDRADRKILDSRLERLAKQYRIPTAELRASARQIPTVEPARADKILRLLQKLADTLSGIGERRLELITRLRQVAKLSAV